MCSSFVDMNEIESSKHLRMLELDAYSNVLAALRAQGPPTCDKLKLLKEIATVLRIPEERCKAEIRKVVLDEKLNTIAYFTCGQVETTDEWVKEGRRLISLMPRIASQNVYSTIADEVANATITNNEQLNLSIGSDRKRSTSGGHNQMVTPDLMKSQFRIPDGFRNEEGKKRKLSFGIENNTLPHLIGPSKISRIQQIYRQKVKTKAKEQQLHAKFKQDQEQQTPPQARIIQQLQQTKLQKQPLSVHPAASSSPAINILQNVSIRPPNNNNNSKGEETIEQIKNEINNFMSQKPAEQNHTSPQPGCSNENQAPKQKQTIINIKPNSNISYKHVASPGPSSEGQKSLKVCSTRKPVTKSIPGQKLIIVSNAQSIATSSILQRTLTIPFVKNISVKNFDKFKIVSTTNSSTTGLQITSIATTSVLTSSTKHKVVTVRTNPTTKKVIPLAHLHALNAKGSIKMLPVGGKILTKTSVTTSSPSPIYIMNSMGVQPALTKSTLSTSVVMTARQQDSIGISNEIEKIQGAKPETVDEECNAVISSEDESTSLDLVPVNQDATKSSVLEDILKASGVISSDNEVFTDDIETQITQLTAIPQIVPERIMADETRMGKEVADAESSGNVTETENSTTYVLLEKEPDSDRLLKDTEDDTSSNVVIDHLESTTNSEDYKIETTTCHSDEELQQTLLNDDSYKTVDVQNTTTSVPNANAVN